MINSIGRNTIFGNPVILHRNCPLCAITHNDIDDVLACYKKYLWWRFNEDQYPLARIIVSRVKNMPGGDIGANDFRKEVLALDGKILVCPGCGTDNPKCHGKILKDGLAWLKTQET